MRWLRRSSCQSTRRTWYGELGDYEKAIADLTEAIRLDSNYAAAYHNRGCTYECKKEYDNAIASYSGAIWFDRTSASTYSNRGAVYDKKGEYDKAMADFSEASNR